MRSWIIRTRPSARLPVSSSNSVLRVWSLALALSAVLAAAGERWPEPLAIRPALVWTLVLLPPLVMAVVLVAGWSLPGLQSAAAAPDAPTATRGESGQGRESEDSSRENG